ncbi:ferredoxin [Candidatus Endolissoclinum faulkneri L2]|uniref:Ferredoxin n=1 Tax=Candidatus Endolissoclinum faulkneri L2 TaxID=1193729 RepID=K7Z560_9PROT|nr:2Fe-2S iron-sulfur cluster-binding protein [Candidatus Endolissoclinum faulkneri]AFX99188.1 ferredoxin [Candidatus Endolissoclinum faulkneri L2]
MQIYVIDREGSEHALEAIPGWRIMEIIRDSGLPITAECGGACACATCHIYVDPEWWDKLEPRNEEENNTLDLAFDVSEYSRLSCQILFNENLDGLKMTLAPE